MKRKTTKKRAARRTTPAKAPRPKRVPRRLRALGGVDPRELSPGSVYPCDDPRVGTRAAGRHVAGTVLGCAVPPAGKRGRHYAVGAIESGADLSREEERRSRTREALRARWEGPDLDARPVRGGRAKAPPPPSLAALPRPEARARRSLPVIQPLTRRRLPVIQPPPKRRVPEAVGPAWRPAPVRVTADQAARDLDVEVSRVRGVDSSRTYLTPGNFRVYANLSKHNGGAGWHGGIGHTVVIDAVTGSVELDPRGSWAGAATRNWHYDNDTLGKIERMVADYRASRVVEDPEAVARAKVAAAGIALAPLTGSDRQIAWAEKIRAGVLRTAESKGFPTVLAWLAKQASAKFWIDTGRTYGDAVVAVIAANIRKAPDAAGEVLGDELARAQVAKLADERFRHAAIVKEFSGFAGATPETARAAARRVSAALADALGTSRIETFDSAGIDDSARALFRVALLFGWAACVERMARERMIDGRGLSLDPSEVLAAVGT